jgi:hypothetical protein
LQSQSRSVSDQASNDRSLADVELISAGLAQLFHWASFLSLGIGPETGAITALQLTPLGAWVLGRQGATRPEYPEASITVCPNFEVKVHGPDTLAWYYLLKFALTVSVGRASVHQITKRNVQHAACKGVSESAFLKFLEARSREALPSNVVSLIGEWTRSVKIVNLERLLVLEVDSPQTLDDDLLASPRYAKWLERRMSSTAVVVRDLPDLKKMIREMKSDGYFPRVDKRGEETR